MPAPFRDALTRFVSSPSRDHFVSRNPSDPLVPSPCNLNHTQQICARNSLNAKEKPVFIFWRSNVIRLTSCHPQGATPGRHLEPQSQQSRPVGTFLRHSKRLVMPVTTEAPTRSYDDQP